MHFRVRSPQDFLSGLLFIAIAGTALWSSRQYPVGSAVRMGAGDFPRLVAIFLAAAGTAVVLRSVGRDGPRLGAVAIRPMVMIPGAVVVFSLGISNFGFAPAVFLISLLGSFAHRDARPAEAIVTSAVLTIVGIAIFIWGIGLPIPIWPER
jgi:hypothetical protein